MFYGFLQDDDIAMYQNYYYMSNYHSAEQNKICWKIWTIKVDFNIKKYFIEINRVCDSLKLENINESDIVYLLYFLL